MKKIQIDDFCQYHFLSNLSLTSCQSKLLFVDTVVNDDKSDYQQRIQMYDIHTKEMTTLVDYCKRSPFYLMDNEFLMVSCDEPKEDRIQTTFHRISLETSKIETTFTLPIAVDSIQSYDEETYLISATIDTKAADYYLYDESKKQEYHHQKKENEDYLEFDEYPFVYNGAGVINGNRTALFICNKKTLQLKRITSSTMDVESFDFHDGHIIYSGVDFTDVKSKFSWIYDYDVKNDSTQVLYNERMLIYRVFFNKESLTVVGTFGKEVGWIENPKFYELRQGQMQLVFDSDLSLYNSVGTDCRFGKLKNYAKVDGISYFISTVEGNSSLFKYENHQLVPLTNFTGTVDDFAIGKDRIYLIAMKDQNLQDIYCLKDQELKRMTSFNDLSDFYVSSPMPITVKKKTDIYGWVLLPENFDPNQKYPAILDIHGGPKCAYGEIFYHEMQYWVNLGYVVFYCNPRGGDGRGNQFADLRRWWGGIDYEDLMDFTDEVFKRYPNIDQDKVGVTGGSYGGYMTNWIVTQTHRFKAAATQRSISNWITEVTASDYGIDFPYEMQFTDLYQCHDELWSMSPLKYVNNVQTPLLFIHSTEDYRCTFPEALQFYTAIKCRGVETKLVGFKGENHELSRSGKPKHRIKRLYE
ncbi:MAG: S9 family peptidase, partial [Erysipelotrichaceae bacterium]|nr:S9 family peptidase [Erysipelotrichaceae bacterium]